MFSEPEEPTATRMRRARATACAALKVEDAAQNPIWGYAGRTLSGLVHGSEEDGWLRVVSETAARAGGRLWEGPRTASFALPASVPRPALHRIHDWTEEGWSYRAELYAYAPASVVSPGPVLDTDLDLSEAWWAGLGTALDALAAVPTDRVSMREEYIRRAVAEFTGHAVGGIPWSTAHGDLHWANLTGPELLILDWEGWGRAPYGFDAALLHIYALRAPETANHVRKTLAHFLDDPAVRVAELTVCAQVLQAADRTPFYAALADPVRRYLKRMGRGAV
ncbi:hypothetical protein ACFY9C_10700 [Streptomyces filamentosus]|uniref:hypothetical protein n=1 Tax=Streptomyces filamentosus TaxID=67294 RepID=UPI0036EDB206